jgi:hypothetical protein
VQQTDALFFGAQQDDVAGACVLLSVITLFFSTGISVCVSISFNVYSLLKTAKTQNDAVMIDYLLNMDYRDHRNFLFPERQ